MGRQAFQIELSFSGAAVLRRSGPVAQVRDEGMRVATAASAKKDELKTYLDIARITRMVDVATSSEDVTESKPAPDIFQIALNKLDIKGHEAVAMVTRPMIPERREKPAWRRSDCCVAVFSASLAASPSIRDRRRCSFVVTHRHSNTYAAMGRSATEAARAMASSPRRLSRNPSPTTMRRSSPKPWS